MTPPTIDQIQCPKCQASNVGRKIHLRIVIDERGPHVECAACSHDWKAPGQ